MENDPKDKKQNAKEEAAEKEARERIRALYRDEMREREAKDKQERPQTELGTRFIFELEEEKRLSISERIKALFTEKALRLRTFLSERTRREALSQTAGQAQEGRKQKRNLALVFILVISLSAAIVYIGGKNQPLKKPQVHLVKNDFRLAPDTLEKQSFQRQYDEKLERMDTNVKSLQATLEQLNARLKREQEKAKSKEKNSTLPPLSSTRETADVIAAVGKASSTKKETSRLGRIAVAPVQKAVHARESASTGLSENEASFRRTVVLPEEPLARNRAHGLSSYLPAGTFAPAVVLSGVTAPTGTGATANPVPMLLEITDLAQLPNDFQGKVDRCFLTANATGDLSSERVWVRLDRFSCMRRNARAIDVKVRGYVTGEDGKTGVRARVVTRSGQAIANALLLGSISGLGKALSSSASESTTYSSGSIGTQVKNPWRAGAGEAISDAADRIVDYYIKLADKIFPVLELDSGRYVDVVFSQGVTLEDAGPFSAEEPPKEATSGQRVNSAQVFGQTVRERRTGHARIEK